MPNRLPDEIQFLEMPDGALVFRLPRRPAGSRHWIAFVPLVAGVFIAGFPIIGMIFFLSFGHAFGHAADGPMLWFAIFAPLGCHGPICFPLGGYLIFKGLSTLYGHTEIVIADDRLNAIERCGPLRWTKRRDLNRIDGFRVEYDLAAAPRPRLVTDTTYLPGALSGDPGLHELARLKADLSNGKSTIICAGYPRAWLLPLAEKLSTCSPRLGHDLPHGDSQPPVAEESLNPAVVAERVRQPSNSTAIVEQDGKQVTITIPPAGFLRGMSPFSLIWCLGWNLFVWPFTAMFLPAAFAGEVKMEDTGGHMSSLCAICFLIPFWLVGIGSMIALLNCARRRANFVCSPTELTIEDIGILGRRTYTWPVSALRSVEVESKYKGDNDGGGSWSISLVVQPKDEKPLSFLEYRPKPELEWIATTLRGVLGLRPSEIEQDGSLTRPTF
jgi:hypothetical protein